MPVKTCPYCGQEYPDDATVCSIDLQSLDPEPPAKSSRAEILAKRAETSAHMAARPFAVKFAVCLLAFGEVFGLVQNIFGYQSHLHRFSNFQYPDFSTVCVYGIMAVFLYFVYRGKNWARWVVFSAVFWGTFALIFMLTGSLHWDFYFHLLIETIAIVALFQRPSNEWYKGSKKILSEPVPAT